MPQENVEIVRRGFEAVARKPKPDFETMNLLFHREHEYVSLTSEIKAETGAARLDSAISSRASPRAWNGRCGWRARGSSIETGF